MRLDFEHDGHPVRVQLERLGDDRYRVTVADRHHEVSARALPDGRVRFVLGGEVFEAASAPAGVSHAGRGDLHVTLCGKGSHMLTALARGRKPGHGSGHGIAGDGSIVAPMTGTLLRVHVRAGDAVTAADTVAVVSAMKMEHRLAAGIDGVVTQVLVAEGAIVEQDQLILRIEPRA